MRACLYTFWAQQRGAEARANRWPSGYFHNYSIAPEGVGRWASGHPRSSACFHHSCPAALLQSLGTAAFLFLML